MMKNGYGGLLVAFDGPNGVGKSTLIKHVYSGLKKSCDNVWVTKEPTDTNLGNFVRQAEDLIDGESLTCLFAADRYNHLKLGIIPELKKGKIVITDRYVLSSLVLQCMDKVDDDFVLAVNNKVILPDLQISITADKDIIQSRLNERDNLTRFERGRRTSEELLFLQKGIATLNELGVNVINIDNSGNLENNVAHIISIIKEYASK